MSRWWVRTAAVTVLSGMGGISAASAQSDLGPELPSPSFVPAVSSEFPATGNGPVLGGPGQPSGPAFSGSELPTRFINQAGPLPTGPVISGPVPTVGGPVPAGVGPAMGTPYGIPGAQGYVRLNAPMYPCPRPNIPAWTGTTMITNQALAPHEMLYPHKYRAMYPPFYHKVHGFWFWTPFGMRSHEHWKLQGTMVKVNYRSEWPLLMGPHKPWVSTWGGPWK